MLLAAADKRSLAPAATLPARGATHDDVSLRVDDVRGASRCKTQGSNAGSRRETRSGAASRGSKDPGDGFVYTEDKKDNKLSFDLRFRRRQLVDTMFSIFQSKGWNNNAFLKLDTDKNLKISMSEFSQPLKEMNINLKHKDLRLLVSFFDKDGSGGVDFDEFSKRYNQYKEGAMDDLEADELPVADEARTFEDPSPAHQRMLKSIKTKIQSSGKNVGLVFRQLDENGDNHLNTTELQKAFQLMNFDISAPDMHVLFNYLDKNGDKYVNYMEFLEWVEDPNYSKDYNPFMGPRLKNLEHFNHVTTLPLAHHVLPPTSFAYHTDIFESFLQNPPPFHPCRNDKVPLPLRSKTSVWLNKVANGTFQSERFDLASSKSIDRSSFVSTMPGLPLQLQHSKTIPPNLAAGGQTVQQQMAAAAANSRGGFWQSNRVWKSNVIEAAPGTPSHATPQERMQRSSTPGANFLFVDEDRRQKAHVEARRARFACNSKRISDVAASLEVQRQLQAIARTAGYERTRKLYYENRQGDGQL